MECSKKPVIWTAFHKVDLLNPLNSWASLTDAGNGNIIWLMALKGWMAG